jgi:CRP-like cAMP-binding protein
MTTQTEQNTGTRAMADSHRFDVAALEAHLAAHLPGFAGPLSARLAKNILMLAKSYGIAQGDEMRIGLQLAQEDLAQLVGASRQRVNQELKELEREGALRIEPTRLVVLSREKLVQAAER